MLLTMLDISAQHPIAFFCAEFGIRSDLPIYAGGLGILAGDILKEAADQKLPYIGIGLLYRGEGSIQRISADGRQVDENNNFDPASLNLHHVYIDDMPLFIKVHLTETDIWLRVWQYKLGETVALYLLDPDTEQNRRAQRTIAHALYAGTEEEMIKQQLLLGIGGVKLLHALGIHPALYHVNEGRPAFLHWQLVRSYMDRNGMAYHDADAEATKKTVYTNHTLLEGPPQTSTTNFLKAYGAYYASKMGVTIDELLAPGLDEKGEAFSMTQYAMRTARNASAVSQLHLEFCQKRWPNVQWVGITNGVHRPTWQTPDIPAVVSDQTALWQKHLQHKTELMEYVRYRCGYGYDPNRLVLTWSRRMTGYKRVNALFEDLQRLHYLVSQKGKEVQILIAGKAHMNDTVAKDVIQSIIHAMQNELSGYALFIPNLDMDLDMHLTRGSDVWLNTPEFGREASGTSGMKALANGVLQCTVPDGWAHEIKWDGIGWTLDDAQISESIYHTLETKLIPEFFARDLNGIPKQWVSRMQKSIALAPQFSATRMMHEYFEKLYN